MEEGGQITQNSVYVVCTRPMGSSINHVDMEGGQSKNCPHDLWVILKIFEGNFLQMLNKNHSIYLLVI